MHRRSALCTLGSLLLVSALLLMPAPSIGSDCCDPESPFREGEGWADKPATCEDIAHWAERAPKTEARISLSIKGKLTEVHWTGVIAYLVMCDPNVMQVVCVTYETNDMRVGEVVSFGGGFFRRGDKQIFMDPCLAFRE